jgi:hypothetical protein
VSLPPIIGLNGVARAGKDTVAEILHSLYGYEVLSFSTALNNALIALNPIVDLTVADVMEEKRSRWERLTRKHPTFDISIRPVYYKDLEASVGYEQAKENSEVRRLLQAFGTEVGRRMFGEDVWVEALFRQVQPGTLIAISNVRFPNEYNAVKERGGVVWRVERPGYAPANGHISDTALDDYEFDQVIQNDSSVPALADKVIDLLAGNPQRAHNIGVRA